MTAGVVFDEDGCCVQCGADTTLESTTVTAQRHDLQRKGGNRR